MCLAQGHNAVMQVRLPGHMFWLKILQSDIPIYDFLLHFKHKRFTMVSFIIIKEGSYSNPSGAQPGRVLDSRPRGRGFEPQGRPVPV